MNFSGPRCAAWRTVTDDAAPKRRPVTIEDVTAAMIVVLILLGIGIVVAPLLRLREWLRKSPPGPDANEPPDGMV
jgi:hypothetical protein